MADKKGAGRPQKAARSLTKNRILSVALPMIQNDGVDAVSFRRLADALDVTPMAIKYHVGTQQDLLAALVERAFAGTVDVSNTGDPAECLRTLLSRYCARALENANLVRCVLSDPSLMRGEVVAITDAIRTHTRQLSNGDPDDALLNLLVDYTHGFVFAAVAAQQGLGPGMKDFHRCIDLVLELKCRHWATNSALQ